MSSIRLTNPLNVVAALAFLAPAAGLDGVLDGALALAAGLAAVAVLYAKPSPWETRRPARLAAMVFGGLQLLSVISFAYSAAFNGLQSGPRDWLELPRWTIMGLFVVHLIRHHDDRVERAMEFGMLGSLYAGAFLFPGPEYAYKSVLTACWFLFYSRARLRLVHSAAALLLVALAGGRFAWPAAALVLSAAAGASLYESAVRGRARWAPQLVTLAGLLLLTVPVLLVRSATAPDTVQAAPGTASVQEALRAVRRSPVLGWGPACYEPGAAVDDQYLSWLVKGGAVGAGVIIGAAALFASLLLRSEGGDARRLLGAAVFLGSVALLLLSGRFLDRYALFFSTAFAAAGMFARAEPA